jgi:hypothetical protein
MNEFISEVLKGWCKDMEIFQNLFSIGGGSRISVNDLITLVEKKYVAK